MNTKLTVEQAQKEHDEFLAHLNSTLDHEELAQTLAACEKLLDLAMKPGMLNVFAMVNAQLTLICLEQDEAILAIQDQRILLAP